MATKLIVCVWCKSKWKKNAKHFNWELWLHNCFWFFFFFVEKVTSLPKFTIGNFKNKKRKYVPTKNKWNNHNHLCEKNNEKVTSAATLPSCCRRRCHICCRSLSVVCVWNNTNKQNKHRNYNGKATITSSTETQLSSAISTNFQPEKNYGHFFAVNKKTKHEQINVHHATIQTQEMLQRSNG